MSTDKATAWSIELLCFWLPSFWASRAMSQAPGKLRTSHRGLEGTRSIFKPQRCSYSDASKPAYSCQLDHFRSPKTGRGRRESNRIIADHARRKATESRTARDSALSIKFSPNGTIMSYQLLVSLRP
jgi:hypothetical protein